MFIKEYKRLQINANHTKRLLIRLMNSYCKIYLYKELFAKKRVKDKAISLKDNLICGIIYN